MAFFPYSVAAGVLAAFWVLYRILAGTASPWQLVVGADGRPSASKFQWFLWTVIVIFSYVAIYAARARRGQFEAIAEMPPNLLIAMGLSVTTMVGAKAITVAYVTSGQTVKPRAEPKTAGPGAIFLDDHGFPDLSKIQMVAWNLIGMGTYLIRVAHQVSAPLPTLPDIDPALMVLMGLGKGAYLGKKLTTTTVPRLTGLSPASGKPGIELTMIGLALGDTQNGSQLTIDANPFHPALPPEWRDTQIKFTLPPRRPDGQEWFPGQRISLGVIVGGRESINTLPFTVSLQ